MKTVRSSINKNIKMILVIAAVTAVALGGLLLLISGNNERDQVPTDPTESGEATEQATEQETTQAQETEEERGISDEARELFSAKVDSISDSAAVAKLLETIDLKTKVANYMVELQTKESPKSVNIRLHKTVAEADKNTFDRMVQGYALQILALINDAQQVQWTYTLIPQQGEPADVTIYLNQQQAAQLMGSDVKRYGADEKTRDALLKLQKGSE